MNLSVISKYPNLAQLLSVQIKKIVVSGFIAGTCSKPLPHASPIAPPRIQPSNLSFFDIGYGKLY